MRFDRPTTLETGLRVRVRLPHAADRGGLRLLFARGGTPVGEHELRRRMRHEPLGRLALCVLAPVDGRETVVAFGAIDPEAGGPEMVIADEAAAPGAGALVVERLRDHAAALRRVA